MKHWESQSTSSARNRNRMRCWIMMFGSALWFLLGSFKAYAEEPAPEAKEGAEKEDPKGPRSERPELSKEFIITNDYVHKWISFPSVHGKRVLNDEMFHYKLERGKATVVIFLASWCQPCQDMTKDFLELQERYDKLHTDFIYVFSHDTQKDASDFIKHLQMTDKTTLMANPKLLRTFKEPELPSIFVGDRTNWLFARYDPVNYKDLANIDDFLRRINSY